MKQKLMSLYFDLRFSLPATCMKKDYDIRKKIERVDAILWGRYKYDVSLSRQINIV
jgi:hypothetical protein